MDTTAPTASLAIFDCDGVLIDSELIAIQTLLRLLQSKGLTMREDQGLTKFLGRSSRAVVTLLRDEFGVQLTDTDMAAHRRDLEDRFSAELRPMPWIEEALASMPPDLHTCVASSSDPERIQLSLRLTGLLASFEGRIFSATQVARGKPCPDLFLHAAAACGVEPENCVVIEDSEAGVIAAQAAGMRVLAFTGGSHAAPGDLATRLASLRPTALFQSMKQLPGLLRSTISAADRVSRQAASPGRPAA